MNPHALDSEGGSWSPRPLRDTAHGPGQAGLQTCRLTVRKSKAGKLGVHLPSSLWQWLCVLWKRAEVAYLPVSTCQGRGGPMSMSGAVWKPRLGRAEQSDSCPCSCPCLDRLQAAECRQSVPNAPRGDGYTYQLFENETNAMIRKHKLLRLICISPILAMNGIMEGNFRMSEF